MTVIDLAFGFEKLARNLVEFDDGRRGGERG